MLLSNSVFFTASRSLLAGRVLARNASPLTAFMRFASIMGTLKNKPEAFKKKKRLGRGPSSGKVYVNCECLYKG